MSSHLFPPLLTSSKLFSHLHSSFQLLTTILTSSQLFSAHSQTIPALLWPKTRCTSHLVVLCITRFAQSNSQYCFVLQSLHEALPSTTLYYKSCTKCFPVLLCTTSLRKVLYTQQAFTQRSPYTEKLLHRKAFTHSKLSHREAFTQKSFYTQQAFTQRSLYTQQAFTQRSFYTQKPLHRQASTHGSFFTQKLLHTHTHTRTRTRTHTHTPTRTRTRTRTRTHTHTHTHTHTLEQSGSFNRSVGNWIPSHAISLEL